jgi:hypothetical protein
MRRFTTVLAAVSAITTVAADDFNILQHLGGNGQWFPGMYNERLYPTQPDDQ